MRALAVFCSSLYRMLEGRGGEESREGIEEDWMEVKEEKRREGEGRGDHTTW
jgi:hypothetical protein